MNYDELKVKINEYNWDDGFELPSQILENENCDFALALEIFYLADGYAYLEDSSACNGLQCWRKFIIELYNNILSGEFKKTDNHYTVPLSKVDKYKFRKKQVPEIFLNDL